MHVLVEEFPAADAVGARLAMGENLICLDQPYRGAGKLARDISYDPIDPAIRPKLQGVPIPGQGELAPGGVALAKAEPASGRAEVKLCEVIVNLQSLAIAG
jgi:hypothetical protein